MKHLKVLSALLASLLLISCGVGEQQKQPAGEEAEQSETREEQQIPEVLTGHKIQLRFDENGEFRVLMMGDVQSSPPAPSERTMNAIRTITEREQPDLVLFSGDNSTNCGDEASMRSYLDAMTAVMEENGIPWAHVYGNHDEDNALSRKEQQVIYETYPHCVSRTGPEDLFGVSNYLLPIYSSDETKTDPVFAIWALDTGNYYTDEGLAGEGAYLGTPMFQGHPNCKYGYMPFSQVAWYYETSLAIENYLGYKLPSMMYFHIALQEYYEMASNTTVESVNFTGEQQEYIGSGPLNSGMFTALLERGDVSTVVCGHDHLNYFSGEYGGINLSYAGCITYDHYHDARITGARVFVIHEDNPEEIESYMSYVYGVNLKEVDSLESAPLTFEDASVILGENTSAAADGGVDGSAAVLINGEGKLTLYQPYTLGSGRYVKMWVDVPADSSLNTITIRDLDGIAYTADLTTQPVYVLTDGEENWIKYDKDEALPADFSGEIAVRFGYFFSESGERAVKDMYVSELGVSTVGSVTVDRIYTADDYK